MFQITDGHTITHISSYPGALQSSKSTPTSPSLRIAFQDKFSTGFSTENPKLAFLVCIFNL